MHRLLSLICKIPFISLTRLFIPPPPCSALIFPFMERDTFKILTFQVVYHLFTMVHLRESEGGLWRESLTAEGWRRRRKEALEERRVSESERAPAPAGVNICFGNLNNRTPVICISDNGRPYGSVDPHCAAPRSASSRPPPPPPPPHHGPLVCPQLLHNLFQKFCLLFCFFVVLFLKPNTFFHFILYYFIYLFFFTFGRHTLFFYDE